MTASQGTSAANELDCDVLILGAGPTGLYGAYYAGFRGFSVVVMDALPEVGGQLIAMYPEKEIYDVAGFPSILARDLVANLKSQADQFDPTYLLGEQAFELDASDPDQLVVTGSDGTTVRAKVLIICAGIGSFKPRPLPIGDDWDEVGVVYFVPDLESQRDKNVVIVGGGDSAFDWAWSLRDIANSVTLVHRRDEFRAHASMVDKVREAGTRMITSAELTAIHGDEVIERVEITTKADGSAELVEADTVVAALGFLANIGPIAEWGIELDKRHVMVDTTMATNVPRIYAAGDATTYDGKVPLISVGFGEVATAVNNASPIIDPTHGVFPGHSSEEPQHG
ncbi:MAG: NAD(P)/FAD-dependent oxidoreductase [Candidatus Nanopelagicales bacterium]